MKLLNSLAGLGLLFVVSGCGAPQAAEQPPAQFVSGRITLDGEPLPGAIITFIPTGNTKGDECVGQADEAGLYTLSQFRGGVGAQSGKFRVVIEHHVKPDGTPMGPGEAPREVGAVQVLPPKYSSLASTVLEADVPEGGGEVSFELTSK
ncbi:MAG: carboxypeptidase regulatory-like domain-containing protein [Planctomycetaceae bacterium]|nr:carboxypeptidase regulatory-like domain-containing protein [Planctomycetaceae bacterium]